VTLSMDESMAALGGRIHGMGGLLYTQPGYQGLACGGVSGLLYTQPGYQGLAGLAGKSSKAALAAVQQQFAEAEAAYNNARPTAERAVSRLKDLARRLQSAAMAVQTASEGRSSVLDYVDQVTSAAERAVGAAAPLDAAFRQAEARWKARYDEAKAGSQNVLTIADAKPMMDVATQAEALAAELEGADADARKVQRQVEQAVASEKRRDEDAARIQREDQARAQAEQQRILDEQRAAREEAARLRDVELAREQARIESERAIRQAQIDAQRAEAEAARQERTGTTQAELEWRKYEAEQRRGESDALLQLELQRLEREEAARLAREEREAKREELETLLKLVAAGMIDKGAIAQAYGLPAPQQQGGPMGVVPGMGPYAFTGPAPQQQQGPFMYPPQMTQPPAVVAPQVPGFEFEAFTPGGQMFGMRGMGELTAVKNPSLPPGAQVEAGYRINYVEGAPNFTVIRPDGKSSFAMTYRQMTSPGARIRDPQTGAIFYTTPASPDAGGPSSTLESLFDKLSSAADKGAEVYGKVMSARRGEQAPAGGYEDSGPGIGTYVLGAAAVAGLGWGAVKLVQKLRK
jgi:hypothetical protein